MEDQIAKLCLEKYDSLSKKGKPTNDEWTVLSGVVLKKDSNELKLVSLATGTKCLSGEKLKNTLCSERGIRLSDSHAEILARRSFLRYLCFQIDFLLSHNENEIFVLENGKIDLKPNVEFHFFSSQTPCGDCSIIPKFKRNSSREVNVFPSCKKQKNLQSFDDLDIGSEVLDDVHRTGAKCLEFDEKKDLLEKGINYHTTGLLRTKPGRGDRTLSLSCSDKIARSIAIGWQGALLSLILPNIFLRSIVIGGGCPFSHESMKRGLWKRFNLNVTGPMVAQSTMDFPHKKSEIRIRPCPSSIIWCSIPENDVEIAVDGYKQGVTKKLRNKNYLEISRKGIFRKFLAICDKYANFENIPLLKHPKKISYLDFKKYSLNYQKMWKECLKSFAPWPVKPAYLKEVLPF